MKKTIKNICIGIVYKIERFFVWLVVFSYDRFGLLAAYQPNPFRRNHEETGLRPSASRYEAMTKVLPKDLPLTVVDIGCQRGYFVFRFAERGGFCMGLEQNQMDVRYANALATKEGVDNASFTCFGVDSENVDALPDFDLVVCMSVFHHFARKLGEEEAKGLMRRIADHAKRYIVFETGEPEETSVSWASALNFMKPDTDTWVVEYLKEIGFDTVHRVGRFPSAVSGHPRHLYVGERTSAQDPSV